MILDIEWENILVDVYKEYLELLLHLHIPPHTIHTHTTTHAHTEGEKLTGGELEEFINQVVTCGTLQDIGSEVTSQLPKEMLRSAMSLSASAIEKFLSELSEGVYDSPQPKGKVCAVIVCMCVHLSVYVQLDAPVTVRARAVKAELTDIEGLGFKLEERQQDILQLKKNLKMKVLQGFSLTGCVARHLYRDRGFHSLVFVVLVLRRKWEASTECLV